MDITFTASTIVLYNLSKSIMDFDIMDYFDIMDDIMDIRYLSVLTW